VDGCGLCTESEARIRALEAGDMNQA
jgi:hypothetical protein